MPVDDRTRLNMHRKLEAVLGHDDADTLMAHLPAVTWNEVATKADLLASESSVRADIERLGDRLRAEFYQAMNRQIRWMVTVNTALVALALTAARLLF
jgi:hypothetical protein